MINNKGFTLIELMICIAIVGILAASAMPLYDTFRQRARGSEASVMLKQLANAQIAFFLDNNEFYPTDGNSKTVPHEGPSTAVEDIADNLNIIIPQGHHLDYTLSAVNTEDVKEAYITVYATEGRALFDGVYGLMVTIYESGNIEYDNL